MKYEAEENWAKESLKEYVCYIIDEYFDDTSIVRLGYDKNELVIE